MIKLGSVPYVFLQVILTKKEYHKHLKERALNIVDNLNEFKFEKNRIELLGIVGVDLGVIPEFKETVDELTRAKAKIVFVSGESQA